jgi:hypothetical protein
VVRLDCPLCGAVVSEESEPVGGRCPGCGARYLGGADSPPATLVRALAELDLPGDGERVARELFVSDLRSEGLAITSDDRNGFYAWWLFVADDATAHRRLARLVAESN